MIYNPNTTGITYDRAIEIASKVIDALVDNTTRYETIHYCRMELDMSDEQLTFFGLDPRDCDPEDCDNCPCYDCVHRYMFDDRDNVEEDTEDENDADWDDSHEARSCTNGDYSPTHPWDAPGMSIKDFI